MVKFTKEELMQYFKTNAISHYEDVYGVVIAFNKVFMLIKNNIEYSNFSIEDNHDWSESRAVFSICDPELKDVEKIEVTMKEIELPHENKTMFELLVLSFRRENKLPKVYKVGDVRTLYGGYTQRLTNHGWYSGD